MRPKREVTFSNASSRTSQTRLPILFLGVTGNKLWNVKAGMWAFPSPLAGSAPRAGHSRSCCVRLRGHVSNVA